MAVHAAAGASGRGRDAEKTEDLPTSLGSYDQALAAPSMKAALEAWGSNSNLRDGADGQALLNLIGTPLDDQGRSG
ncbi:hypothetical protein ABIF93_008967 [Bradyrhizobium japonicum]